MVCAAVPNRDRYCCSTSNCSSMSSYCDCCSCFALPATVVTAAYISALILLPDADLLRSVAALLCLADSVLSRKVCLSRSLLLIRVTAPALSIVTLSKIAPLCSAVCNIASVRLHAQINSIVQMLTAAALYSFFV
eukprot:5211-Heterococcus_DN1.PRE.1